LVAFVQDYKIPGTNIELKVDDMVSVSASGIQARVLSKQKLLFGIKHKINILANEKMLLLYL
jgi:hypothetical protein